MKAEYYPPNEDVILQNEGPTEMYILVTGAVVRTPSSSPPPSFALFPVCVYWCLNAGNWCLSSVNVNRARIKY